MDTPSASFEAAPFTARQCPTCDLWVYTGNSAKSTADYRHWRKAHATQAERDAQAGTFPFFMFNEVPVVAVKVR